MTHAERANLLGRTCEIAAKLRDVVDLRVNYDAHPDEFESELLAERREILNQLWADWVERRAAR